MAERVGFEPTEPVKVQQFSRLPDSTALAPLRTSEFSILDTDTEKFKSRRRLSYLIFEFRVFDGRIFARVRGIRLLKFLP